MTSAAHRNQVFRRNFARPAKDVDALKELLAFPETGLAVANVRISPER
jgi:hypothetical protein